MYNKIITTVFLFLFAVVSAFAQTAALLPNAVQQFFDQNGNPLSAGTVTTYAAGTSTLKTTWRNSAESIPNTNPIILDAGGKAIIYGDGVYRQVVRDRNGNLIWDAVTSAFGTGGATQIGDGTAVGTVLPWSGITAPVRYVFAYGQELSRITYSQLYAAITLSTSVSCTNGSPILTGISDTSQIPLSGAIEASCIAAGTTVIAKTASTVTVSNNANITNSVTAKFFPWGNGNGTTTFNVPDLRAKVIAGRSNMGGTNSTAMSLCGNSNALAAGCGAQSEVLTIGNLPAYTPTGTIVSTQTAHSHALFANTSAAGGTPSTSNQAAVQGTAGSGDNYIIEGTATAATLALSATATPTITSAFTGVAQGGGNSPFTTIQPSVFFNYVIKILPDVNISSLNVVTSLASMTGDIACGVGLLCSAQTISTVGLTAHSIAVGAGVSSALTAVGPGTAAFCLMGNGASLDPSFQVCPGAASGTVTGPGSAIDNSIVLFNGTSGNVIKDSQGIIPNNTYFRSGSPWVDVRSKGAICNSSTDDTAAFIAASTQLSGTFAGGIIYVPPVAGVCCLKLGTFTLPTNQRLVGASDGGSVIGACGADVTVVTANGGQAAIEHLTVLGKGVNADPIFGATADAVVLTSGCVQCRLINVTVEGGRHAISVAANDAYLEEVHTSYAYGGALVYVTAGVWFERVQVDQLWPQFPSSIPITANPWGALTVYPALATVSLGGYYIQTVAGGTSGTTSPALKNYETNIVDNAGGGTVIWRLVAPVTYYGIQFDTGAVESTLIHMDFSGPFTAGIGLTNSLAGVAPTHIKVKDSVFSQSFVAGVYAEAGSNLQLDGNEIGGGILTPSYGVVVTGSWVSDLRVIGGLIFGGTKGVAVSAGTNTIISNNGIYTNGGNAIELGANLNKVTISANSLGQGIGEQNVNSVVITAGTSNDIIITNNNMTGFSGSGVINGATGSPPRICIANNIGWTIDYCPNGVVPAISAGLCTSPSIAASNGAAAFDILVGSACGGSTGTLTFPAATTGWTCNFANVTNPATSVVSQTGGSTTTVTLTNYVRTTGVAGNFTAADHIRANCTQY